MNDKKFCPMCFSAPIDVDIYCVEKKCSWWSSLNNRCVITDITESLITIAINMPAKWVGGAK